MDVSIANHRIALLVNYLDRAYQNSFRRALEGAARARGVGLLVAVGRGLEHDLPHERALNRVYRWLSQESVDGVVLLSAAIANFAGPKGIRDLCADLAPLPTCSIGLELPDVPSILIDNRAAMRTAVTHLIEHHGCRHVAYISGPEYNEEARVRLDGYRDALKAAGVAFDPERVATGSFTTESGYAAMEELARRAVPIDGLAAANDYMAIGAVDALLARGSRVPDDVKVVGFDDAPIARFAQRSLSSIAQPYDEIATLALDGLLAQLRGQRPPSVQTAPVKLARRDSCGCGYQLPRSQAAASLALPAADFLLAWAHEEERSVAANPTARLWQGLVPELARALAAELGATPGKFLAAVEGASDSLARRRASSDELERALLELMSKTVERGYTGQSHHALEQALWAGRAMVAAISAREHGRHTLHMMESAGTLRDVSQELAMVLSAPALAESFKSALEKLGIETGYLAVSADPQSRRLTPLCAVDGGLPVALSADPYPVTQLFAPGFPRARRDAFLTLLPLTVEEQVMGLAAFSTRTEAFVCEALRSQLSAAVKLGSLHARFVEETAVRERLAHEQLVSELTIARRIQSALCPSDLAIPRFEVAAQLIAADQVGGDYYDVIPAADGCWVGIGDVTGHGLLAGLIMLMIQSSVRAIVHEGEHRSPSELVCHVNAVLEPNIRRRLRVKEYATFMLLRARADGRITMAGAHEDVIVHRGATGRCELFETEGVWVGITDDIQGATKDRHFHLDIGDTIILYTDGLTEARDASKVQFGVERVCEIVRATAERGPRAIVSAVMAKALAWTPVQQDDMTLVALRRAE